MKNTKEIYFVCQYLGIGGAERVMSLLINFFANKEYKVKLIILYEEIIDYKISEKVDIVYLHWKRNTGLLTRIKCWRELGKLISGKTVISFLYSAIRDAAISSMGNNVRLIVSERNDPNNDPKGKWRQVLRTLTYYAADTVVFQTQDQMNYFPRKIRNRGIIIPNPVKEGLPVRNNSNRREKKIVSVCRLTAQKNLKMAIDAFCGFHKNHTEYIYDIYGDGELEAELETYINEKKLSNAVHLKGFSNNVHEEILNSTMLISSSNYEGISNTMLEAMAMGLAVICTDCPIGGARLVIENGLNGILINVGDSRQLEKAMCKLADDERYRENIEQQAIKVRTRYSEMRICSEWEEIVKS